jgi:hypothetical protein
MVLSDEVRVPLGTVDRTENESASANENERKPVGAHVLHDLTKIKRGSETKRGTGIQIGGKDIVLLGRKTSKRANRLLLAGLVLRLVRRIRRRKRTGLNGTGNGNADQSVIEIGKKKRNVIEREIKIKKGRETGIANIGPHGIMRKRLLPDIIDPPVPIGTRINGEETRACKGMRRLLPMRVTKGI